MSGIDNIGSASRGGDIEVSRGFVPEIPADQLRMLGIKMGLPDNATSDETYRALTDEYITRPDVPSFGAFVAEVLSRPSPGRNEPSPSPEVHEVSFIPSRELSRAEVIMLRPKLGLDARTSPEQVGDAVIGVWKQYPAFSFDQIVQEILSWEVLDQDIAS